MLTPVNDTNFELQVDLAQSAGLSGIVPSRGFVPLKQDPNRIWCTLAMLTLMFVSLAACTSSQSRVVQSRVVGEYAAEHENGKEMLQLRADGMYVHSYQPRRGAALEATGKWEFRPRKRARPIVVLHDFAPHFPGHDGHKKLWELEAEEDYGMIRLYVDAKTPRQIYLGAPDST